MLILRNGTIYDGTGGPVSQGDVLISGERIAAVGRLEGPADAHVLDCTGLAVAPGFIDGHTHSDLQVLNNRPEKPRQGVTTEVVGNCGFSPYPMRDAGALRGFGNGLLCGNNDWGWRDARAYLDEVRRSANAVDVVTLVGHGSLRLASSDVAEMERMLEESLDQGAAGLSTGLMYAPRADAPTGELVRLCRVVARKGKIYTSHIRDYMGKVVEAVDEQLDIARRSGCRLQISHMQAVGPANWARQAEAIEKIEKARAEGVDVTFDCYPYVAGSSVLTENLPQWALEGGLNGLLARLADASERRRVAAATASLTGRWVDVWVRGRDMVSIAAERGTDPAEAALQLIEEDPEVIFISFNQSEQNLRVTLTHALSMVISDGFFVRGRPHPRLWGTFPLLLGEFVRERRWMPLECAIYKITGMPAERFGLPDRGRLAPGLRADVTVFDPATVNSPATYENPEAAPVGIKHVIRGGAQAVR